jgi:hypothetical protein
MSYSCALQELDAWACPTPVWGSAGALRTLYKLVAAGTNLTCSEFNDGLVVSPERPIEPRLLLPEEIPPDVAILSVAWFLHLTRKAHHVMNYTMGWLVITSTLPAVLSVLSGLDRAYGPNG